MFSGLQREPPRKNSQTTLFRIRLFGYDGDRHLPTGSCVIELVVDVTLEEDHGAAHRAESIFHLHNSINRCANLSRGLS